MTRGSRKRAPRCFRPWRSSSSAPPPAAAFPSGTAGAPPAAWPAPTRRRAVPRTQSAAAVTADGERWFLLNASPGRPAQLGRLRRREPAGTPALPIEGMVLTDAELDHSLGLVLLREARFLQLVATPAVKDDPDHDSGLLPVTQGLRRGAGRPSSRPAVRPRSALPRRLSQRPRRRRPFAVPAGPPRFARAEQPGPHGRAQDPRRGDGRHRRLRARLRRLRRRRSSRPASRCRADTVRRHLLAATTSSSGSASPTDRARDGSPARVGTRRQPGAARRAAGARAGLHPHQQHATRCCSRTRRSAPRSSAADSDVGSDGMRFTL